jgi:predicted HAD superfamily Cof-like phosphohydrolase
VPKSFQKLAESWQGPADLLLIDVIRSVTCRLHEWLGELQSMSLQDAQSKAAEFHRAIGASVASRPTLLASDRNSARRIAVELRELLARCHPPSYEENELLGRLALELEELAEWVEAHANDDLIAAADAWGDRLYVLLGDAAATGLPAEEIFAEIHRSNMTKTGQQPGSDRKGVTESSFQVPKLANVLGIIDAAALM